MKVIEDQEAVDVIASLRTVADQVNGCASAEALFAYRAEVVEMLECAGDYVAVQARMLGARPAMPKPHSMLFSVRPPSTEGRADGDTWADMTKGRFMVLKDGEWLDPAEGICPPSPPVSKKRGPVFLPGAVEGFLHRLSYALVGAAAALVIMSK